MCTMAVASEWRRRGYLAEGVSANISIYLLFVSTLEQDPSPAHKLVHKRSRG
jgi:hypothetical protein